MEAEREREKHQETSPEVSPPTNLSFDGRILETTNKKERHTCSKASKWRCIRIEAKKQEEEEEEINPPTNKFNETSSKNQNAIQYIRYEHKHTDATRDISPHVFYSALHADPLTHSLTLNRVPVL